MRFRDFSDAAILSAFPENKAWPGAKSIVCALARTGSVLTTEQATSLDFGEWAPCVSWKRYDNDGLVEMEFDLKMAEASMEFARFVDRAQELEKAIASNGTLDRVFDFLRCEKSDVAVVKCRAYSRKEFKEAING